MKGIAKDVLREELEGLRLRILDRHLRAGQKASGRTAESLRVEVSESEGTLYGRSAFETLEKGRRGGKVPAGFREIIYKWMMVKGIRATPIPYKTNRPHKYTPQERGDLSLSYLIAKKIKEEGTKLFRDGGRDDIYSEEIPETTRAIMKRLVELLKVDISNIEINKKVEI